MATTTRDDWRAVAGDVEIPTRAVVDEELRDTADGARFECVSPIDGRVPGEIASSGPAFESRFWSRLAPMKRRKHSLEKYTDLETVWIALR